MPRTLHRLVYRSDSNISHDNQLALRAIFQTSLRNNRRDKITGALALPDGKFVQVLEGSRAAVSGLMKRLAADDRHSGIAVLGEWPITARLFTGWAMAHPDPEPLDLQAFRIMTLVGSGAQVVGLLRALVDDRSSPMF